MAGHSSKLQGKGIIKLLTSIFTARSSKKERSISFNVKVSSKQIFGSKRLVILDYFWWNYSNQYKKFWKSLQ